MLGQGERSVLQVFQGNDIKQNVSAFIPVAKTHLDFYTKNPEKRDLLLNCDEFDSSVKTFEGQLIFVDHFGAFLQKLHPLYIKFHLFFFTADRRR